MQDPLIEALLRPGLRLDAMIARGSFGTVFRARQLAVDRDVAVKVLHSELDPETEPGRLFRDEIRAIGIIDHRNVVRIFDADDTADGRIYFVMELLDGPTLQQVADAGPISWPRAIHLIGQLLDGLAAVHAAGHIHADVKPSNILVVGEEPNDRVVLIDFGLSRLRRVDQPAEAVGGTRSYMAPEQLRAWELEARSDVFSAALVLVRLITGWQRSRCDELVPPLDGIEDPGLRRALERALALEPSGRPSAADFARALRGGEADEAPPPGPSPPFRELAPLTERDRGRLFGREADVVHLARRLESGRAVVLTAPSGTGKTSLLRAGLVPYLDAAGLSHVYVACERGARRLVIDAVAPSAGAFSEALTAWHVQRRRRLVVILDQLEVILGSQECEDLLNDLLDPGRLPPDADLAVVLAVREDFVARLLAATSLLADGVPQVRLGPLDRENARAAILQPLAEHELAVDPPLLDALLDDLVRGGAELGAGLGWGADVIVYPPHLQLAGNTLLGTLGPRETTLTLEHYRQLGGFDAIVGEHLERSLARLPTEDRAVARDLFLMLVASAQTRAIRDEAELLDGVGALHGEPALRRVLDWLVRNRLVTRRVGVDGAPVWSLAHDTLVPRIEAWLTVHDLDRRRAAEVVRFHLRQSQPDSPAVFGARELRTIARFPGLVDELQAEWARRSGVVWTPRSLLARSHQVQRNRRAVLGGGFAALVVLGTFLAVTLVLDRRRTAEQGVLRDRDIGRVDLEFELFELAHDSKTGATIPIIVDHTLIPGLAWNLYEPSEDDLDSPGRLVDPDRFQHGRVVASKRAFREENIQARGGAGYIVVSGRGRRGEQCGSSVIPVRHLPGYAGTGTIRPTLRLQVPTCQATWFGMIEIPPGPFIFGGPGDPPSSMSISSLPTEDRIEMPRYWIDRTEITNGTFGIFASMSGIHDIWASTYPGVLADAGAPGYPRADIDWFDARAYCRFLGKELPTSRQWQKALRGGLALPEGTNLRPRRSLPYGDPIHPPPVTIAPPTLCADSDAPCHPVPVERNTRDRSPYGVLGLAGNLQEWMLDHESGNEQFPVSRRPRLTRGGNWADTTPDRLVDYLTVENTRSTRSPRIRTFFLGARCARSGEL